MSNPAPLFIEEETLAVIDGLRIETYCPGFVLTVDTNKYGDVPAGAYNSRVLPVSEFAGHPAIDDYIAYTERINKEYLQKFNLV